jgi:hypothetical protein
LSLPFRDEALERNMLGNGLSSSPCYLFPDLPACHNRCIICYGKL